MVDGPGEMVGKVIGGEKVQPAAGRVYSRSRGTREAPELASIDRGWMFTVLADVASGSLRAPQIYQQM